MHPGILAGHQPHVAADACSLFAFGGAMMIVVISKPLFMGWDITLPMLNFTGFSGHTASSSALYLSIALLLTQDSTACAVPWC
jgi:hypothetical protein